MNIEDIDLQRFYFRSSNACLQLTTYMEFSNGTKGCVLILNFNNTDSQLILINSSERAEGGEQLQKNILSNNETDIWLAYRKECEENHNGYYCISLEMYDRFGAVLLAGQYLTAHIADYFCHYINERCKQAGNPCGNWSTERGKLLMHNAIHNYTLHEIEDEISDFLSNKNVWARTIIWQTLKLHGADKIVDKVIQIDTQRLWNTYIDWLERANLTFKLCFAERLLRECNQLKDWQRLLEDSYRTIKDLQNSFRFSRYGIQEIVGLYALCKYYYMERPDKLVIRYASVEMSERIPLYGLYHEKCTEEMLVELENEDNPLRTTSPTEEEADKKARIHISKLVGRQPYELPEEQKATYALYEQGFCLSLGIKHPGIPSFRPKEPAIAELTTQQTNKNKPSLPTIKDLENVFLPCYTNLADCRMLLNILLDIREKVSDPEWGRYALTIYECKKIFRNHPKSFKEWLPKFCALFGREVEYRAPSDIRRTKCKTDITPFLPNL